MEVRLATSDDIDALCPLVSELFAYNAVLQPRYCAADIESGEYPKSIIESDNAAFLVATKGGAMVGFIHISQMKTPPFGSVVPHRYAEIIAFMVTATHRRQGIGSKLIDAAKQWSKARKLDYIELITLNNAGDALRFYERENFATVSYIKRYTL